MPIIRRKDERKAFTILGKFGGGQPQPIDYSKEYFFIEDLSGEENVLTIRKPTTSTTYVNVSVSTDKVNWFDLGSTESGNLTYTIPSNGKLYVRGNNAKWSNINGNIRDNSNSIYCSKPHNVCGNIMSLLYGDDFAEATELNRGALSYLFDYNQKLQQANNLILPATTLEKYCYTGMFYGCISLTTAPELPATTLANYCYQHMFEYCTKLNKIVTYANSISATNCLYSWVVGVSPTGDFYNLGGATYPSGSSGIPEGWTEHTSL